MFASLVLAIFVVHTAVDLPTATPQEARLEPATSQTQTKKLEQPWPPTGVFRPGGEVTRPKLTKETPPHYSAASMRVKAEGAVFIEAVVLTDGAVGEVRVIRSLDKEHRLDDEAVRTVKEWQFIPGKKDGVAVPVVVEINISFSLK